MRAKFGEAVQVQRDFEPNPGSAGAVRRLVAEALPGSAPVDDVVLIASELATNVIRHAKTRYTVRLSIDHGMIRLEVSDGSSIVPALEDLVESQRGLRIVDSLTENWGIEGNDDGKTIWANFPLNSEITAH